MAHDTIDPFTPAVDLAAAVRRKDVIPVELVDLYLDRMDRPAVSNSATRCPVATRRPTGSSARWTNSGTPEAKYATCASRSTIATTALISRAPAGWTGRCSWVGIG